MKLEEVTISQKRILQTYSSLPEEYRKIIETLYTGIPQNQIYQIFKVDELIRPNRGNNLIPLKELKDKVGVYIFINENCEPVYVGLTGRKEKSSQSLRDRLQKQLNGNEDNSTLAKNIREIESLLNTINEKEKPKELKEWIVMYTTYIIVIITGELKDNEAIKKAQNLETVLIALLRPKYNK